MRVELLVILLAITPLLMCQASSAWAAEAPLPPDEPPAPESLRQISREAQAPYQVVKEGKTRVRWLDPAVFTEISPLTVPEVGLRLPEDQVE